MFSKSKKYSLTFICFNDFTFHMQILAFSLELRVVVEKMHSFKEKLAYLDKFEVEEESEA